MKYINAPRLISEHEKLIEILEAIKFQQKKKEARREYIVTLSGNFPELSKRYEHDIDIIERSISRLYSIYIKKINQLV